MALQPWVGRSAAQLDADSPLDITLHNSYDDDLIHLRQVLYGDGAGTFLTPIDGHKHGGGDSSLLADNSISGTKLINYAAGPYFLTGDKETKTWTVTAVAYEIVTFWGTPKSGTLRVQFSLTNTTGTSIFGRLYKNGAPIGIERETATSDTWSQDIDGLVVGDQMALYCHKGGGGSGIASNVVVSSSQATALGIGAPSD